MVGHRTGEGGHTFAEHAVADHHVQLVNQPRAKQIVPHRHAAEHEDVGAALGLYNLERLRTADTLLLGRSTFEGFRSYWPPVAEDPVRVIAGLVIAGRVDRALPAGKRELAAGRGDREPPRRRKQSLGHETPHRVDAVDVSPVRELQPRRVSRRAQPPRSFLLGA